MYEIPTLSQLMADIRRDLGAEYPGALLRSDADVFGRALAGAMHGAYGYLQDRARQILPGSADEATLTSWHGPFYLLSQPLPAVPSRGLVRFTGNAGAPVPVGAILQRDDQAEFAVLAGGIVGGGGYVDLEVQAVLAGYAGDTAADAWLMLAAGAEGVDAQARVQAGGLSGGADAESIESYRQRIVDVRKAGAQTGRAVDWVNWAKEVPGVTRAWAAPKLMGVGSMVVYIMRDDDAQPYPASAECSAVLSHLETTGTPWGELLVVPPIQKPVNVTLRVSPDTPTVRAAVTAALAAVIAAEASPVARDNDGRTVLPVSGVTIPRSHLTEAISAVPGEFDHALTLPAADVVCAVGELAELGVITWT